MSPDLPILLSLLEACRAPDRRGDYPSAADLEEIVAVPANREATRVWYDAAGGPVAFAIVDGYANLWFEMLPAARSPELGREIVAWAAATLAARLPEATSLDTNCREDDGERRSLLEANSFTAQPQRTLSLVRRLDGPLPEPVLPAGFVLRPVTGASEAPALVALHQAAFGTSHLSLEERLAWMAGPRYDPELDLAIAAPDGALAGSCFCSVLWDEAEPGTRPRGATDPVVVHPAYRRRGLARALLAAGMRVLAGRGVEEATLSTASDNLAMLGAAQAVGYRVETVKVWYQMALTS